MPLTRFRMVGPHQTPVDNEEYKRLRAQDHALNKLFVGEGSLGTEMERLNRRITDLSAIIPGASRRMDIEYYSGKMDGMRVVLDRFEEVRRKTMKNIDDEVPF